MDGVPIAFEKWRLHNPYFWIKLAILSAKIKYLSTILSFLDDIRRKIYNFERLFW